MLRAFFCIFVATFFLHAKMQDVQLIADSASKNGDIINAVGNILVSSDDYVMSANKASYNDKTKELELFGNVNIIRGANESIKSEYIKLDFKEKIGTFEPFFTYNDQKDMWVDCKKASSQKKFYITKHSVTSSCDVQDPDWKIGFSTGQLDKKTRFLQLYNVVLYVRDFPLLYLPYFAISTDTTRRSGLLIPALKYGTREGFFYEQPIYVAEYDWWDLEIKPQIRTDRGYGVYGVLRFIDSSHSNGSISAGAFRDKSSYKRKENLQNQVHKGFGIDYENNNILEDYLKKDVDDALLLDFTHLNDIDYLNLKNDDNDGYGNLVKSRLNYFLRDESDYLGVYGKYYIDTEQISNENTIQELPTLQYHRFVDDFIMPNLLYSFDLQYHNYIRRKGVRAGQIEANLPITWYKSFFDEFLHVNVSENIYASYVNYSNSLNKKDAIIKNYHEISLNTDLAKGYEDFFHTIKFGLDYIIPSWERGEIKEDFIGVNYEGRHLRFGLVQFFYDKNGNKKLKHSLKQVFYADNEFYKYADLENFISYYFDKNNYIKNELNYSYKNKYISKFQTDLHVEYKNYSANLIHTFQYGLDDKKENFLIAYFNAKYPNGYSIFANTLYDIADNYAQSWKIGFKREKKCWNFTVHYRESISPKLTSIGSDNVKKKGFYVAFELYPLGGTDYDFAKESSIDDK